MATVTIKTSNNIIDTSTREVLMVGVVFEHAIDADINRNDIHFIICLSKIAFVKHFKERLQNEPPLAARFSNKELCFQTHLL